ncbi:MAG: hypothetical protein HC884_06425 [Chloroflexaceae bacterium]|nr:hypothetical protein [Chloroflexaceae bacterium]
MEAAISLLTVLCSGAALYLWWHQRTPIYLLALISGSIGSLVSPLWPLLYGSTYASGMTVFYELFGLTLSQPVVMAASWFYPVPALVVLYLYRLRWWLPGYLPAIFTYLIFLFYHVLIEVVGLNLNIWSYQASYRVLPLGIAHWFLSALMAALISLALLYLLLLTLRQSWDSMGIVILPSLLLLNLLVRGLLGAPVWISLLFRSQSWAASIGMISTLALLAWALHIVAWGMSRVHREITV